MVRAAAPVIHSVRVSSSLVSGGTSFSVADSIPEILPTSVPAPVAVTTSTPLPWVTGVFMNAMFVRSPGAGRGPGSVPASFTAGTLSPVSADSSICRALASMMRPSAATWSPAAMSTMSPTTRCSAGISASVPSLRTRAVAFIIDCSAFIALSALPSWRRPRRHRRRHSAERTSSLKLEWPWGALVDQRAATHPATFVNPTG